MATPVAAGDVHAQDYEPADGDSAVVYVSKFKAAEFERAKTIMVEGFSAAMEASGQTRRTFWLANAETAEIVSVTFFQKGHSVEEWHEHDARQAVMDQLAPLRSAPIVTQEYLVVGSHKTGR